MKKKAKPNKKWAISLRLKSYDMNIANNEQTKLALEVENRFDAKIEKKELFQSQENINGFNFAKNPIITDDKPNIIQPLFLLKCQ